MNKLVKLTVLGCFVAILASAQLAQAQDVEQLQQQVEQLQAQLASAGDERMGWLFGSSFGAGLVILGAGFGIGRIGGQAVEAMSRQPEVAGNIQTAMIISAALIEGATFFALIVCMLFN